MQKHLLKGALTRHQSSSPTDSRGVKGPVRQLDVWQKAAPGHRRVHRGSFDSHVIELRHFRRPAKRRGSKNTPQQRPRPHPRLQVCAPTRMTAKAGISLEQIYS